MLLRKNESSLKQKKFYQKIIFHASGNLLIEKKVYKTKAAMQNSAITG